MVLAYIDPGLGALLWQAIVAGFVGFLFYLRKTRRWIVHLFLKLFTRGHKPESAPREITVDSPEITPKAAPKIEVR